MELVAHFFFELSKVFYPIYGIYSYLIVTVIIVGVTIIIGFIVREFFFDLPNYDDYTINNAKEENEQSLEKLKLVLKILFYILISITFVLPYIAYSIGGVTVEKATKEFLIFLSLSILIFIILNIISPKITSK